MIHIMLEEDIQLLGVFGSYSLYVGTSKFFYFIYQSVYSVTIDSFSSLPYKFSISQVYIVNLLSFSLSHAHDCV